MFIALKGHSFYNLFIFARTQKLAKLSSSLNKKEMMEEEVVQLHVATPTYATHPVSLQGHRKASSPGSSFPAGVLVLIRSSFPAGAKQGFLSLLVLNRSSFLAGAKQGFLSLLMLKRSSSLAGAKQGFLLLLVLNTLLSLLVLNRVFFLCWCLTGLPSLLVLNRVFFLCWCATRFSFPAGAL